MIRVLGPFATDGATLSPRERVALSVLVVRRPEPVSSDELADVLWGDHPPVTSGKQVQVCVSRLRAKLPPATIETTARGYRLAIDDAQIDSAVFAVEISRARELAASGDTVKAADGLVQALGLWRGEPFPDLPGHPAADTERARLLELRRQASEELLEVRLVCGEHKLVAAEAEALVLQEPLRERRWYLLALAQYRCGRQGDALETLRRARRVLARELGVDPGRDLVDLERAVLHQDPALDAPVGPPTGYAECPYRGLAPYESHDRATFFGRDSEIERCLERLGGPGLLVITGPSGCGKSSLVRAGLIPRLAAAVAPPACVVLGDDPVDEIERAEASAHDGAALVIDQFEEMFVVGHDPAIVRRTLRAVATVAVSRPVVLAVRADVLGELGIEPTVGTLVERGLHLLRPLDEQQLRQVIEAPAATARLRLEPGLTDLLLRDAGEGPGPLPLLSHALAEIWKRRDGAVLTVEGYRATGGISAAVATTADSLYEPLSQADREVCRSMFLHLVELTTGGSVVRRRVSSAVLRADASRARVLAALVNARLVTLQEDTVEIAHEALIRAWPRLRSWLEDDTARLRMRRHLSLAAEGWDMLGRPDSELYRGARLELALESLTTAETALTALETEFVDASRAERAAAEAAARALAVREARTHRRVRRLLVATAALLVVTLGAGVAAVASRNQAVDDRATAQLEAVVNTSLALRATDRDIAALLAVEAYRRYPDDVRARSALLSTFTADPGFLGYRRFDLQAARLDGATIPGQPDAVVVFDGHRPAILDLETSEVRAQLDPLEQAPAGENITVRASADGRRAAILTGDAVVVDDLAGATRLLGPVPVGAGGGLALSADGELLATPAESGAEVIVRRVQDGVVVTTIDVPEATGALGFTAAGDLIVGLSDGLIRIVDPADPAREHEVHAPPGAANLHIVPVDDKRVVTAGSRGLFAFDPSDGRTLWTAEHPGSVPGACDHFAVAAVAGRLFCGDWFGVIQERDIATGAPTGVRIDVQLDNVGDLGVSADGWELVAFGAAEPVLSRWRLDGSGPATRLIARGQVAMDGFDPGGEVFVAAERPPDAALFDDMDQFSIWDVAQDRARVALPAPLEGVGWAGPTTVVGYDPVADALRYVDAATGADARSEPLPEGSENVWPAVGDGPRYLSFADGTIWTVDPATNQRREPTIQVGGEVGVVAPTPDGSTLAVTALVRGVNTLTLHDAATGRQLAEPVEGVKTVAVSDRVVVGAYGGTVTAYDLQTLAPVATLPGARGEVNLLRFSADGATLMAASNDQTVSVYDAQQWVRLGDPIPADAPLIYPGQLRPDGRAVLVNVREGVAEWTLDPERLHAAACKVAGRNLTPTEWASYLGDLGPYRATCPGY